MNKPTMTKKQFKITIDASPEKVWHSLFDDQSYREWTTAFAADSHAETDWKKGSKALFLDGKGNGMVATIEESIPNKFLSIKHLGEIIGGKEDLTSERVTQWAGAHENYTLTPVGSKTEVTIDMDITEEFLEMFSTMWPKALEKLKTVAERSS
jgi:hypothetical protein